MKVAKVNCFPLFGGAINFGTSWYIAFFREQWTNPCDYALVLRVVALALRAAALERVIIL